jgi:hypothetical protein
MEDEIPLKETSILVPIFLLPKDTTYWTYQVQVLKYNKITKGQSKVK